jgi:glutamine amidotransferase
MRIAVVDHGAGNLVSVEQALTEVGCSVVIARDPAGLAGADGVVLPGVGAAAPAMARLARSGLLDPLHEWLAADRPLLGICLGLQLLFEGSDEDGARTLGVLAGRTELLADAPTLPHIGWNQVAPTRAHPLFDGIPDGSDYYFVHSYAGAPSRDGDTLALTAHGRPFVSAVARGRTLGVQFHPERSGDVGLRLLANFIGLVSASRSGTVLSAAG